MLLTSWASPLCAHPHLAEQPLVPIIYLSASREGAGEGLQSQTGEKPSRCCARLLSCAKGQVAGVDAPR